MATNFGIKLAITRPPKR